MPKAFRFRLETPLEIKRLKEDEAKGRFAESMRDVNAKEEYAKQLIAGYRRYQDEARGVQAAGAIEPARMQEYYVFFGYIKGMMRAQMKRILHAKETAEKKRLEMLEASKERKGLEILKERLLDRYKKDIMREEIAFIDDISSGREARKRMKARDEDKG